MCGITGIAPADPTRPVDPERLRRMTDVVRHRGPDGEGFHVAPGIGLGMRRLSIVDLEHGDQPIASESGEVVLVCNGEIYNAPELRAELEGRGHRFRSRSDVEVIVHLYEERGDDCVHALRGMFAFALWDAPRRRLLLARDRVGIKPLLWAECGGELLFGSEAKSILAGGVAARIDMGALGDVLTLGFSTAPRTIFDGVRRLPPGHRLVWEAGRLRSITRWWSAPFPIEGETPKRSVGEWTELMRSTLDEAVRLHLRSDVPVGTWLSPGIDSSALTALMRRYVSGTIEAFTLGFEDPSADELRKSTTLDAYPGYDIRRHVVTVREQDAELWPDAMWYVEEPTHALLEVPRIMLARKTSEHVKTILAGEGSDEILGGYYYYGMEHALRRPMRLPLPLRRLLAWRTGGRDGRALVAPRALGRERYAALVGPLAGWETTRTLLSAGARDAIARARAEDGDRWSEPSDPRWSRHTQLQHVDFQVRLPDLIEHMLDRQSMAGSLEARVPFLDHHVVEMAVQIPPELLRRDGTEKWLLREAVAPLLPEEIARRRKRGLRSPGGAWLKTRLPAFAEELLSPERLKETGYFDPRRVIEAIAAHQSGRDGLGGILVTVLAVQVWDDVFVRGNRPAPTMAPAASPAQRSGIPLPSQSAAS